MIKLIPLLFLVSGCVPWFPWENIDDHIQAQKAANPMGCGFIVGGGNPPASRLDGGASFGWGDTMTPQEMNDCLDKLKEMR